MKDMNMMPMCSVCDIELEYTKFVFDGRDGDIVWYESYGYCPECGREYRWYEENHFAGIAGLECVSEKEV